MSIDYVIAPPELMTIFHNGVPAAGAKIYTFEAGGGTSTPKATYADGSGTTVNPNPVICDAQGNAKIYWKRETGQPLYYVVVKTADSTSIDTGVTIWSADNYPAEGTASGSVVTVNKNIENYLINGDLSEYGGNTSFDCNYTAAYNQPLYWNFYKSNTNATETISRKTFALGQTDVPHAPLYYTEWECTATGGGGETEKMIENPFGSITDFDGDTISFSIYAKASGALAFTVEFVQDFGQEGSPSTKVTTTLINTTLTTSWAQYTAAGISIPGISGKTIGALNSYCSIRINFPLNTTGSIALSKANLFNSTTVLDPLYETRSLRYARGHYLEGFPTGTILSGFFYLDVLKQAGWIQLVDGTIGNTGSGATIMASPNTIHLYKILWNSVNSEYVPIASPGADWYTDWTANRPLTLPATQGKALVGRANSGTFEYLGSTHGDETHVLTIGEMPSHYHSAAGTASAKFTIADPGAGGGYGTGGGVGPYHESRDTTSTGSGDPHNNIQPSVVVNRIIKL